MAEAIHCPQCARELRIPENLLGKRVKCPGCGTTFTAPAPGEAAEPAEPPPTISEPGVVGEPGPTAAYSIGDEGAAPPSDRPKEIGLIGNFALFGGIWACLLPFLCCLSNAVPMILNRSFQPFSLCCFCPEVYSLAVGVLSIMAGLKLRGPYAYVQPPPKLNAILRIVNLIAGDLPNAILGAITLYWLLQKPEVKNYYKGTASGIGALLPTKTPTEAPPQ
jgi:predicted Zn finger-like uncharacterized protein